MKSVGFFSKENIMRILKTLKYSLYVIVHPLDGFWDLNHEKRGSVEAATIILILAAITSILSKVFSSFLFVEVRWSRENMIIDILGLLAPVIIGVVSNWCITTLFDGKGTMSDIYMAACYSLTPYILINIPLIFVSNIITVDEGSFYTVFQYASYIWCGALMLSAMMMIHDFGLLKAIIVALVTVLGMLVIIFLMLLFFSLVSDAIAYFVSIYKELSYRLY